MGLFSQSPPVPQVGDKIWWRGMEMEVIPSARPADKRIFSYKNAYYRCTSKSAEAYWNAELGYWMLPGVEGVVPKFVRGKLVKPELPRCYSCDQVTYRRTVDPRHGHGGAVEVRCTGCRVLRQEAQAMAAQEEISL